MKAYKPGQLIAVDLCSELITTPRGNKYILSIVDYATRYAMAIALPDKRPSTVIQALLSR